MLHPGHVAVEGGEKYKSGNTLRFQMNSPISGVKNKYVGFDKIKDAIMSRDYSLPNGMTIKVDGCHRSLESVRRRAAAHATGANRDQPSEALGFDGHR